MASAARALRLCLRNSRSSPAWREAAPAKPFAVRRRCLSSTPSRWEGEKDNETPLEEWEIEMRRKEEASERITNISQFLADTLTPEQRAELGDRLNASPADLEKQNRMIIEMRRTFAEGRRTVRKRRDTFWNDEEPDPDMITDELNEDDFNEDDITSMAHGKLDEIREQRNYARIAVWEMPLLSKFAKPFEPPSREKVLRFRYTSYMGEFHPAERKVVVEFCPADLDLTEVQQMKLKKLVGARYNPEKEIVRMSCEMFEHQAQNKRYLGDLVEKLIAEAKDPSDTFEDIPLDTRHHTFKTKPKFPVEWRMTEERRKELQAMRAQSFLLDETKKAEGSLIDGVQRIQDALAPPPGDVLGQVGVEELVRVKLNSPRGPALRR